MIGITGLGPAFDMYGMNSSMNVDTVACDFERYYNAGADPNQVLDRIMYERRISEKDFTDMDIENLNRKVEAIYKAKNFGGRNVY